MIRYLLSVPATCTKNLITYTFLKANLMLFFPFFTFWISVLYSQRISDII